MSNHINIWDGSAETYAKTAASIACYRETARRLVLNAHLLDGMKVLDLACGSSGVIIDEILSRHPNVAMITGVDSSQAMLDAQQSRLKSDRVSLVCGAAELIDTLSIGPFDRVFCNSAVWLFNMDKAFCAIRRVMAENGSLFLFNISEWDMPLGGRSLVRYEAIDLQLQRHGLAPKRSRGSVSKVSLEALMEQLASAKLCAVELTKFTVTMTVDDWVSFYSIPAIAQRSMPELEPELSMEILGAAMRSLMNTPDLEPLQWLMVTARPSPDELS